MTTLRPELEVAALSGEVDAVMRGIVERLMLLTHADGASISTIDDGFAYFRVCAGEDLPLQGRTFRLEETLGAVCMNGELAVLRKTTGPEVDRCLTPGAASIALAPLEWDGQVRGVLGVRSSSLEAFDEAGVEEVRTLTAGASIALRNAELIAKLAASEHRYRELHDRAADAILVFDSNNVIVDANEAAATLLLRPVEELRGLQAQDLFTAVELAAAPLRTDELMRTGELRSERPFLRKDGTEIMVEYSCRALDGGRVHTSLRDVTQRRRNEDRLRTSLGRLHAIVQTQQQIAALELDPDALTSTIVLRAQRLCGGDGAAVQWFEGHESVYHHGSGIAAGHIGLRLDRSSSLAGLAALNDEAVYSSDTSIDPRADADICVRLGIRSLICAPLHRDNAVVGVLSILGREPHAFDELSVETARLMAEFIGAVLRNTNELQERGALLEQLQLQDQVVEHMQTALYVFAAGDRSLRLRFANKATEAATGLPIADVMGRPLTEIFPNVPPALIDRLLRVVETGEVLDAGQLEYSDDRIGPSIFSVKAFRLHDDGVAVTFDNVTDVARIEGQLRQAQKMEAVGRLAGGIAHDFNNLLTAISGYSEFLIGGTPDPKLRRYAEEIKRASDRAAALTGQLLAFSRRQVLQPRILDLNATVGDMDMMLRRLIGEDVELVTMLGAELAPVRADPTQIEQVIINLAVNARDAMPHGGSVTIETANVVDHDLAFVELRLTDTGVGMTEAERRQLFDPFFTTKEGGTGLGLATVYGIVEQSGGTIEVESAPGLGSSFRVLLPAEWAPIDGPEPDSSRLVPAVGEETILLVEDELVVRRLIAEILESNGYTVLQAGDGPSALELLRRHTGPLDLLVTDVVMPGMSGRDVAGAVAAMRPGAQVLYISGYTDSSVGQHGVLEPGIAFLQKPFDADVLTRKVREVLDGVVVPVD
ncbi:MAG TPA: ATP-binding protein [Gaiellaceae bacterium]|nr:ATP-binding protein [Gaiellaceae bacterium]